VVNSVSGDRRRALLLSLVDNRPDGVTLSHLGAEVVRFARTQHGTVDAAATGTDEERGDEHQYDDEL